MNDIVDFGTIAEYTLALLPYVPLTLGISAFATVLGTFIGLVMALIKMSRIPVVRQLNAVLVSYLRGTPILVQLLLNVNAVPIAILSINRTFGTELDALAISPFLVAGLTFALHEAAYSSETIRAALGAVDRREIEAAQSLGMTSGQTLRRITIPIASVIAFPTLVTYFVGMLKQSSLAFLVSMVEVTAYARILGGRDYRFFEAYLATAIIYWVMTVAIEQVARRVERRMQRPESSEKRRRGLPAQEAAARNASAVASAVTTVASDAPGAAVSPRLGDAETVSGGGREGTRA